MKILKSIQILKALLGLLVCIACSEVNASSKKVAITQIAPHPSLDQIRQGVEDELKSYDPTLKLIFDNAQGNIATATQIAQKFLSLQVDVVVPITTPSAQTVCSTFKNASVPIVFAAVSDPYRAKIVSKDASSLVTGVSDRPPLKEQLQLMKSLIPTLRKIGVLYNAGEDNSQSTVEELKKLVQVDQLEIIEGACSQTSEVSAVALNLLDKVDALFIPNDNMIISALDSVLKVAQGKKPVFTLDPESVEKGCLASAAYDQYEMGRRVGKIVIKILQGQSVKTLPVEVPDQVKTSVNLKTAQALGIVIPNSVLSNISNLIGD